VSNEKCSSNLVNRDHSNLGIEKRKEVIIQSFTIRIEEQVEQMVSDMVVEISEVHSRDWITSLNSIPDGYS